MEWFLFNNTPEGYTPFSWLAVCEKEIRNTEVDQPTQIFKRINQKTLILIIENHDGIRPKLTTYKLT